MKANEIRQKFFEFFASKGHKIVPSAPMVLKNDPTLMFTNAGMNQFKDIFLGNEPATASRVADTQKCLRVSGKHNDLGEVGHDTYHHTMFEMLGNWSFADYFKQEAIDWAWELLTKVYGLNPERMYATVFEGSDEDKVPFDQEAFDLWKRYLPESHILRGNKKDNFWEMGATGPCGPCSELHYDVRQDIVSTSGAEWVNQDNPEVIEIWNLVFMQFNRMADGKLVPLPACHVDTGMGFERLCMVVQGKQSNYDTDVFQPLLQQIEALQPDKNPADKHMEVVARRVMADHLRAIAFSIADGQLPSNVKAGYVVRRILRRAVRYGYTYLGVREPFLVQLVPTLVGQMGEQFPEIKAQQGLIESVVREEEASFLRTLATGIAKIDNGEVRIEHGVLNGVDAFELYDTFGFPIDLTELIMSERGVQVDLVVFEQELAAQKARSRAAGAVATDDWNELLPIAASEFVGYDTDRCVARVARTRKVNSKGKTFYQIVLDRTPFYGASGGQVGDTGCLTWGDTVLVVTDTIKENNLTVHLVDTLPSAEVLQTECVAAVDTVRRAMSTANHTATHLLHAALRTVLGNHVEQKGSLVTPEYLRFDFSHFAKVTPEEARRVEQIVNQKIRENAPRDERRDCPIDEAKNLGAMMLFGEKYGEAVRVVRFGQSVELCGGLHAPSTGTLGLFLIQSEGSSSAGIRRIEAITGVRAEEHVYHQTDVMAEMSHTLGTNHFALAIKKMEDQSAAMAEEMGRIRTSRDAFLVQEFAERAMHAGDYRVVCEQMSIVPESVKNIAVQLTAKDPKMVVVFGSAYMNKPSISVALGSEVQGAGGKAGDAVRVAAAAIGGGGGGAAGFATAGGKRIEGLEEGLRMAIETIKKQLGMNL